MTIGKVLVAPIEISGIGAGLVAGFRELGVEADLRLKLPHRFVYAAAEPDSNPLVRAWQAVGHLRVSSPPGGGLAKVLLRGVHLVLSIMVLLVFARRYDAFIFIFGRTITGSTLDLSLLRLFGKRTVVLFCGSDARPPYLDGARSVGNLASGAVKASFRLLLHTWLNHRRVTLLEERADFVVNAPSTAQFHRRPYINWFSMGIPRPRIQAGPGRTSDNRVRILHSPSNPEAKGTGRILAIIERLVEEGLPIDLVLLQGASNAQVIEQIRACDIVCDQLYSDTPMAALASEAAALARPALVGGYFAADIGRDVNDEDIPPSCFVLPADFESALRQLAVDAGMRQRLGTEAQAFIQRHWTARVVAERYLRLLRGDAPAEWWCDPAQVGYAGGCGLEIGAVGARVQALVSRFGRRSLMVSDKPALEAALLALSPSADRIRK